jgi:hypothetical protein
MGHNENSAKRKVHHTKCLHKEIKKSSYQKFKSTSERFRSKRSKYTQKELTARNNWG